MCIYNLGWSSAWGTLIELWTPSWAGHFILAVVYYQTSSSQFECFFSRVYHRRWFRFGSRFKYCFHTALHENFANPLLMLLDAAFMIHACAMIDVEANIHSKWCVNRMIHENIKKTVLSRSKKPLLRLTLSPLAYMGYLNWPIAVCLPCRYAEHTLRKFVINKYP